MICSTNFSTRWRRLLPLLALAVAGCGGLVPAEEDRPLPPPLAFASLAVAPGPPLAALSGNVRWTAVAHGGEGPLVYEFCSSKGGRELVEQAGPSPVWQWTPCKPGSYRVKVKVRDAAGAVVESPWSAPFSVLPALSRETLLALLPMENLSGAAAPCAELDRRLAAMLAAQGQRLLPAELLDEFMRRHRMRYTGGIDASLALALREETGAAAVLIASLASYQAAAPPKIALALRVVQTGPAPEIVWMDSVGLSGDDHPGLLGLAAVTDADQLGAQSLAALTHSLGDYLAAKSPPGPQLERRYQPREAYRASTFDPTGHFAVAVVPFLNTFARKNAGLVVPLHFVQSLHQYENLRVIEPGLVREHLLRYRLVMPGGVSLAVADILASPNDLNADLVLSGQVFDYQDQFGTPKVDISTQVLDARSRKLVWWSRGQASGDDGVLFFDRGRVASAHRLAQSMAAMIDSLLFEGE